MIEAFLRRSPASILLIALVSSSQPLRLLRHRHRILREGGEIPSVDGVEIQGAAEALDRLVEEAGIPDKISLIDQFELSIPRTVS